MDEPVIDLQSDHHFMGEALRQAVKAYEAGEVPVGAVVVRAGRVIARAGNQVEFDYFRLMKIIAAAGFKGIVAIEWEGKKLEPVAGVHASKKLIERALAAL